MEPRGNIPALFDLRIPLQRAERGDRQRSVEDTQAITRAARAGQPFLFFPEGTFERMPGVVPFRTGAFLTAAEADDDRHPR